MPKAFSQYEREQIMLQLQAEAEESIKRVGIKRTTVDDLAKAARIPKGTFYLFYTSKEQLVFEVIMQWHAQIHAKLIDAFSALGTGCNVEELTEVVFGGFQALYETALPALMLSGELDTLIRKLPEQIVREHFKQDDNQLSQLFDILPHISEHKKQVFSAAMRMLFFSVAHTREIGEELLEETLRLCIRGLIIQLLEEEQ